LDLRRLINCGQLAEIARESNPTARAIRITLVRPIDRDWLRGT